MKKRNRKSYFPRSAGNPDPVVVEVKRRVHFSDVDVMGVVWHGRYPLFFEEGAAELGRRCGLTFKDFAAAGLSAPIVELHVDYHKPLYLEEEFTIRTTMVWHEGARIDTEFQLVKDDGSIATTGYTVQLLMDHRSWELCMVSPPLLEDCRRRWKAGEFAWQK